MTSAKCALWLLLAALSLPIPVTAQQDSAEPTRLALAVQFYPQTAPAYQTVSAASRGGAWYARFGQVQDWVQPPDSLPVHAVNIKSELAEDGVRVWVSVYLGELLEKEQSVTSYLLHEGENITVRELAQLGVVPFEIKLVRLAPSVGNAPEFVSKAPSIEVVTMLPNNSTLLSYKVVVRNVSRKNVTAMRVNVLQDGRMSLSTLPRQKEGEVLIPPGGTYEFIMPAVTRSVATAGAFTPVVLPNQTIQIATAIFDDASFEGEAEPAVSFAATQLGRKRHLAKVIELFQAAAAGDVPSDTTIASLSGAVSSLALKADSAAVQEVVSRFSNTPGEVQQRLQRTIEVGMKGLRDDVLKDISEFQVRHRRANSQEIREWLRSTVDRYHAWLERL
jgi:hypothetical protein